MTTKKLQNIATGSEATGVLDIARIPDLSSILVPKAQTSSAEATPLPVFKVQPFTAGKAPFGAASTSVAFSAVYDPMFAIGYNVDAYMSGGGGGISGEPALQMFFEADYKAVNWRSSGITERTMEWYVQYVSPDHTSVTDFRPFGFTAGRNGNTDRWATVQLDIGTDASALRSMFFIKGSGVNPVFQVSNVDGAFAVPMNFNGTVQFNGVVKAGFVHGDGTTAADIILTNNALLANSGGYKWQAGGVDEWKFIRAGGGTKLYLNDIVNNINQMTLTQGTATTGFIALGVALRLARGATGARPVAATVGYGAAFYDASLAIPVFSDGTNWRNAAGTVV
jgi:hypothetical protein